MFPELAATNFKLRLRERLNNDMLTTVYHENKVFDHYALYDEKDIAVQIIRDDSLDFVFEEGDLEAQ